MAKEIPKIVLNKAQSELKCLAQFDYPHAGEMRYLGERMGVKYYTPYYPDEEIGYPEVYSLNNKGLCEVHKMSDALNIIAMFY